MAQERGLDNELFSLKIHSWTKSPVFFSGLGCFSAKCHHGQIHIPIPGMDVAYGGGGGGRGGWKKSNALTPQQKNFLIVKHGHYCQTVSCTAKQVPIWTFPPSVRVQSSTAGFLNKMAVTSLPQICSVLPLEHRTHYPSNSNKEL